MNFGKKSSEPDGKEGELPPHSKKMLIEKNKAYAVLGSMALAIILLVAFCVIESQSGDAAKWASGKICALTLPDQAVSSTSITCDPACHANCNVRVD